MLILLPPSETKASRRRGAPLDLESLSHPELNPTRAQVIEAVGEVSGRTGAAAALGVSPTLEAEIARNTRLAAAPTLKAADLYTGVLYDALGVAGMDSATRRRASRRVLVISALFGALRLNDRVPPYRLSMAVNLPGVGPLAAHWRGPLRDALATSARRGLILDCRSSTYAAAWTPPPDSPEAQRWVQVHVPGATHMAKHTRGLPARALCRCADDPASPQSLLPILEPDFEVALHEPGRTARPWLLSATPR